MKLPIVYLVVLVTMAAELTKAGILTRIHNILHPTTTQKATNIATTSLPPAVPVYKSPQPTPTPKLPELNGRIGEAKVPGTKGQSQPQKPLERNETAGVIKVATTPLPSAALEKKSPLPTLTAKSPELNGRIDDAKELDTKDQPQQQIFVELNETAVLFKEVNHKSIITAPVKMCPEGQAMTPDRECRTVYDLGDR